MTNSKPFSSTFGSRKRVRLIQAATGLSCLLGLGLASAHAEPPKVVASIKPVHSLVAQVMDGIGEPALLVSGMASPHDYALKPSEASLLQDAGLVFWIGPRMETFLGAPLETIADDAEAVALIEADGLRLLPVRTGARFEKHSHDHGDHGHDDHDDHADHDHSSTKTEEHDHDHDHAKDDHDHEDDHAKDDHAHDHEGEGHDTVQDNHIWLSPGNAGVMLDAIASSLSKADPDNAARYADNAAAAKAGLVTLEAEVTATLKPVIEKGAEFIVFHDAYQYFETRFGMSAAGAISINPEVIPGAKRIGEIKDTIEELNVSCVFYEPQFNPSIVSAITEGASVNQTLIDPLGATIDAGPEFYGELMGQLTASFVDCLGGQS